MSCSKGDKDDAEYGKRDDGGKVLNIPLTGSLQNPAFSPDDKYIVFTRFIKGYNEEPAEIYKFNLETEELTLLVSDGSGNVNLPGSSWKNRKIVFSSSRDPHDEIFIIGEDKQPGDEIKVTSRSDKMAYEPTFSPDGKQLVFESHKVDVEGDGLITKYNVDGSSSYVELTGTNEDCRQPNWSPSGNKILYQKKENGVWNIWTMNPDGSNKRQLTSNMGNCTDATFTTDGKEIVFSSDYQVDNANIYKISLDGGKLKKLSAFKGYDGAPSISSDGKTLVFESSNSDPDNSSGTKIVLLKL